MIWKTTFLFLFFSTSFSIIGQNLIPNNSFEEKKRCPKKLNQIKFLKNWYSPTKATPDFFYKCNTSKSIKSTSIPKNVMGNQDTFQGNG